jgi:choline dehydrogenase-like flavoprotein
LHATLEARDLSGHRLHVHADQFVFAAGTIETTRLLLLLDRQSDARAFESCDALGRYFQDHLDAQVGKIIPTDRAITRRLFGHRFIGSTRRSLHLELTPEAQQADGVGSAFATVQMAFTGSAQMEVLKRFCRGLQRREIDITLKEGLSLASHSALMTRMAFWKVVRNQLYVPDAVDLFVHVCVEQLPCRANELTLSDESDAFGVPKARLSWALTEREERSFQSVVRRLATYWTRSGFDASCPIQWAYPDKRERIIDHAEDFAHPSGTTRMGTDKRHSVVRSDLRCWHVRNASVVSASTFPTAGGANPTFTLMQLAFRAADALGSNAI